MRVLLVAFSISTVTVWGQSRLINGKPAETSKYKEVVRMTVPGGACTATLVGPRVIATAAHCAPNGATVKFSIDGQEYSAKLSRSSLFPQKDHNLALGLLDKAVPNIEPATIGGKASIGLGITLMGYGCTASGGTGGNDGILRYGETVVSELLDYQMKSKMDQGAVLCFGDSGGPAFVFDSGKRLLLGINSHGNQIDENSNTRTDINDSQTFFQNFATSNQVEICGINGKVCGAVVPVGPTCQLVATPSQIKLGESLKLTLTVTGNATSANIQGTAVANTGGTINLTPTFAGSQKASASVSGPGGSNSCSSTYFVEGPQPNVPNYTVIPTYCGENTVVESGVSTVCLGMIKYSWSRRAILVREVVMVTHSNDTKEVLPVIFTREDEPKPGNNMMKAELGLYANGFVTIPQGMQLDVKKATLIKEMKEGNFVPISISGRTGILGKYFNVDEFKKVN